MEQKTLKNSILLRIQIVHFGKILFNFEILTLAVMLACVMTFIFPAIYYILLFSISVITLFPFMHGIQNFHLYGQVVRL